MHSYYTHIRLCQGPLALKVLDLGNAAITPHPHALARLPDRSPDWLHSYPAHLSRTWTLASGESLFVRPVRHDDGELEETFVRALSLESRYQRMLSGGTKVTPEWIDSMTHIDYHRHMAFAVTAVSDGVEQFVGVGRYVVDAVKSSAEVALVLAAGCSRRCLSTPRAQGYAKQRGLSSRPTWPCSGSSVPWASR